MVINSVENKKSRVRGIGVASLAGWERWGAERREGRLILYELVRKGCCEKAQFEQRPEGSKGMINTDI